MLRCAQSPRYDVPACKAQGAKSKEQRRTLCAMPLTLSELSRLASEIFLSSLPIALMMGSLVLSGCLYMGRDFVTIPVKSIENNVTTQREIFGHFGEPIRKGLENGYETWTYSYQFYEFGQLRDFKELYVVFNKDNTVRSYSFSAR
jgi:hypothetical protein